MFYTALENAPTEDFKRATGVSDFVFFTLLQAYQTYHPRTAMGRPLLTQAFLLFFGIFGLLANRSLAVSANPASICDDSLVAFAVKCV